MGDGPDRVRLTELAATSGAGDRVRWAGHVADRATYLDRLAEADAFVFPSPAEGFPKVVLDAFAVGLPVLATTAGTLDELAEADLVERIATPDPDAVLASWRRLVADGPGDRRRAAPASERLRGPPHPLGRGRATRGALAIVVARPAMGPLSA